MPERGPLSGLRVVDMSPTAVGAQASQLLADFGADVVWVESPGGGWLRDQPAFPFLARGKRSLTADLHTPEGVRRVRDLARSADVLIETFRPGKAERLGLGYADLQKVNPSLIYTSITGFGRYGPWAQLKGYEGIVAAILGVNASFARTHSGEHPPFISVPWCSFAASQTALHGVLAALLERERSGRGQWVEANLAQAFATLDPWAWFEYLVAERWPEAFKPLDAVSDRGVPTNYMSFSLLIAQTKDGRWLQFAQNAPRLFQALMRVLGLEEMLDDPAWAGIPVLEDEDRREVLWHKMLHAANQRTLAEWTDIFSSDPDVFAELYRKGSEVLDHRQLAETGAIIEITDPVRGPVRQPGPLIQMTRTPAIVGMPAPVTNREDEIAWAPRRNGDPTPPRTGRGEPVPDLPLQGITMLELAVLYAAPYAATLLTDLGARVIKIEQLAGDPVRNMTGFPEVGGAKATQGKESIAVDLSTPEGKEIVYRLAARADAVIEGFRTGAAERLGVDAETLLGINPDLVYLSAHGYGLGGPFANRAAFAPSIGAAAGIAGAILGDSVGHEPCRNVGEIGAQSHQMRAGASSRYAQADGFAALGAASALLLGLVARARGHGGQHLSTSMLLTAAHAVADQVISFPGSRPPPVPGPDMRGPSALYRVYDAADGWVFLAAPHRDDWDALVKAMASDVDLCADPRFATETDREDHDSALAAVLAGAFATRGAKHWQELLTGADVACVEVYTGLNEPLFMSDKYGRASGYIADVEHPVFGPHPRLAPMVRFSRSMTQARPGTLCGAATQAVLEELGYSMEQIADLKARQIVG